MGEIHDSIDAAIRNIVMGDALLAAALPGGLWFLQAPARRSGSGHNTPYAVFCRPMTKKYYEVDGTIGESGQVRFQVASANSEIAGRIASRAGRLLAGARVHIKGGRIIDLAAEVAWTPYTERGPNGRILFGTSMTIEYATPALEAA